MILFSQGFLLVILVILSLTCLAGVKSTSIALMSRPLGRLQYFLEFFATTIIVQSKYYFWVPCRSCLRIGCKILKRTFNVLCTMSPCSLWLLLQRPWPFLFGRSFLVSLDMVAPRLPPCRSFQSGTGPPWESFTQCSPIFLFSPPPFGCLVISGRLSCVSFLDVPILLSVRNVGSCRR